jgi:AcrR family transcriptional regulator
MYNESAMARTYTLKRRAEAQAETRQRIVEAAVALHGELGPALTTRSAGAERAGVQRNTLYAHFPDERSLLMACSGLSLERDPLPDPGAWKDIKDRDERLRTGLAAVYGWYARNEQLVGCVLRDAQYHAPVREIAELRYAPILQSIEAVLGERLKPAQRALLRLALDFGTWRSLVRESGLAPRAAVEAMASAIGRATAT